MEKKPCWVQSHIYAIDAYRPAACQDYEDYESEAEELADLLADNRFSELAELDEDDLTRVIESIRNSDPAFDVEITGFMEDEAPPFRFGSSLFPVGGAWGKAQRACPRVAPGVSPEFKPPLAANPRQGRQSSYHK